MLKGDWISQTGAMVCGGDGEGPEVGAQRAYLAGVGGGGGGCPHWAGKVKKTEGPVKKRGPGKGSSGKVE